VVSASVRRSTAGIWTVTVGEFSESATFAGTYPITYDTPAGFGAHFLEIDVLLSTGRQCGDDPGGASTITTVVRFDVDCRTRDVSLRGECDVDQISDMCLNPEYAENASGVLRR